MSMLINLNVDLLTIPLISVIIIVDRVSCIREVVSLVLGILTLIVLLASVPVCILLLVIIHKLTVGLLTSIPVSIGRILLLVIIHKLTVGLSGVV